MPAAPAALAPSLLRPAPLPLRRLARPSTLPRRPTVSAPRPLVRCKSGPFGYTQAKALVYAQHGEPSDVLR